ncbi:hypothetical protein PFISCL1PPCAC_533, partial [Pristionchus fissidentatus]
PTVSFRSPAERNSTVSQMVLRLVISISQIGTVIAGPAAYRDEVNWPFGLDEGTASSSSSHPSPPSPLDCSLACSAPLQSTLRSLLAEDATVRGNLDNACRQYTAALECVSSRPECES